MAGKELEIKFRLPDKDFKLLSKWLSQNAKFTGEEDHEEYYFDHREVPFTFINDEGLNDAADYLRLRKEKSGRYSICLKRWKKHPVRKDEYTHCDEYEFEISDAVQAKELLENIGFFVLTPIIKSRKKFKHNIFEIVIDEVKNLGRFVEIELKEAFTDTDVAYEKIYNLLRKIGIKKVAIQERGHVTQIMNPDHDFSIVREL